jgi:hypothetical protein
MICLQIPRGFLIRGRNTCQLVILYEFSYNYVQTAESLVSEPKPLMLRMLLKTRKSVHRYVRLNLQPHLPKHVLISVKLLILFGVRKNDLSNGRYLLLNLCEIRVVTRAVESESESEGILGGVGVGKNVPTPTSI